MNIPSNVEGILISINDTITTQASFVEEFIVDGYNFRQKAENFFDFSKESIDLQNELQQENNDMDVGHENTTILQDIYNTLLEILEQQREDEEGRREYLENTLRNEKLNQLSDDDDQKISEKPKKETLKDKFLKDISINPISILTGGLIGGLASSFATTIAKGGLLVVLGPMILDFTKGLLESLFLKISDKEELTPMIDSALDYAAMAGVFALFAPNLAKSILSGTFGFLTKIAPAALLTGLKKASFVGIITSLAWGFVDTAVDWLFDGAEDAESQKEHVSKTLKLMLAGMSIGSFFGPAGIIGGAVISLIMGVGDAILDYLTSANDSLTKKLEKEKERIKRGAVTVGEDTKTVALGYLSDVPNASEEVDSFIKMSRGEQVGAPSAFSDRIAEALAKAMLDSPSGISEFAGSKDARADMVFDNLVDMIDQMDPSSLRNLKALNSVVDQSIDASGADTTDNMRILNEVIDEKLEELSAKKTSYMGQETATPPVGGAGAVVMDSSVKHGGVNVTDSKTVHNHYYAEGSGYGYLKTNPY